MEERYESSQKAGIIGILGNIFLLIIKGAIGFFTHSQAMIALMQPIVLEISLHLQ